MVRLFSFEKISLLMLSMSASILFLLPSSISCAEAGQMNLTAEEQQLVQEVGAQIQPYKQFFRPNLESTAYYITFFKTQDQNGQEFWTVLPLKTDYGTGDHESNLLAISKEEYPDYLKTHVLANQQHQLIHLQSPLVFTKSLSKDQFAGENPGPESSILLQSLWNAEDFLENFYNQFTGYPFFSLIFTQGKCYFKVFDTLEMFFDDMGPDKIEYGESHFNFQTFHWAFSMYCFEKNRVQPQQELIPCMNAPGASAQEEAAMEC